MSAEAYMGRKRSAQPYSRFPESHNSFVVTNTLPRRPQHRAAAKQMNVKVIDCLAAIRSSIDDCTKSLRQSLTLRNARRNQVKITQQFLVFRTRLREGCDVFPRHDQDVRRRLRINIAEGVR